MAKPVLVCVDDENILLESLRIELRRDVGTDFQIETAESGEEALDLIKQILYRGQEIVMVISDENMPGMKGHELLSAVKDLDSTIATVLLTGYSNLDAVRDAVNLAGLYRYITKPWKIEELRFTIRQAHQDRNRDRYLHDQNKKIRRLTHSMIFALEAANQNSDEDTAAHIERVAEYAAVLAQGLGKDREWVERLRMYSKLHDIGKIGVSCQLVNTAGHYTEKEKEIMKQHVRFGWLILGKEGVDPIGAQIARYHHERWDGQGYLEGLQGDQIPLEARIVAIADVFDALTTPKAYRAAVDSPQALEEIGLLSGTWFDPALVKIFTSQGDALEKIRSTIQEHEDLVRPLKTEG